MNWLLDEKIGACIEVFENQFLINRHFWIDYETSGGGSSYHKNELEIVVTITIITKEIFFIFIMIKTTSLSEPVIFIKIKKKKEKIFLFKPTSPR